VYCFHQTWLISMLLNVDISEVDTEFVSAIGLKFLSAGAGQHFKTRHLMAGHWTPAKSQAVCKAAFKNDVGDIDETLEAACDVSVACAT
jgi:hypothetical protein